MISDTEYKVYPHKVIITTNIHQLVTTAQLSTHHPLKYQGNKLPVVKTVDTTKFILTTAGP